MLDRAFPTAAAGREHQVAAQVPPLLAGCESEVFHPRLSENTKLSPAQERSALGNEAEFGNELLLGGKASFGESQI